MSGTETLWQELICRLEGVQAAQVVFAENGMPCEIHVLAGPEKKFEIAGTRYPVCFDGAVRRTGGPPHHQRCTALRGACPGDFRLAHTGLEIKKRGRACVCFGNAGARLRHVYRPRRKREYAFCPATVRFEAALAAVNRAAGETCFELASVDAVTLAGQGIVVAQVYSLRDGQRLLGSAFLNEDPDNAAVHSVLSAVNRRLSVLPRTAG